MNQDELKRMAIVDANINRVSEGMRVVEDWARFYMRHEGMTDRMRQMRHGLWKAVASSYPEIIKGRDTGEDILAESGESGRDNASDIPRASFNRVKEGLRVLEEMSKLISAESGSVFKRMRFNIYEIERDFYEKGD